MAAKRNPSEPPDTDFYKRHTIEELAARQGVKPVEDIDALRAEFADLWPDDASIDAFLGFLEEGRGGKPAQQTGG